MIPVEPTAEHPVPFDLSDEEPKTHSDSISIASNTVDLISELGGGLDFNNDDLSRAQKFVLGQEKPNSPRHIASTSEAAAAHAIIRQHDFTAFADALQARNFITNKLVKLADCGDPKLELKALELLGKHSDIGLFTERSEITINHTTSDALEKSIKDRVKRLLNSDITDVVPQMMDELDGLKPKHVHKNAQTPEEALEQAVNEDKTDE